MAESIVSLKEIANILNGYAFKSSEYQNKGHRVIRITNVQKGFLIDDDPKFHNSSENLKKYELKENDILISLTGNVGRVGLVTKNILPAYLNQRVGCIRIKEDLVDNNFLFHFLNNDCFENDCINNSKGIAQLNLSTEWLKNVEIKLPSLEDQKKIAKILDKADEIRTKKKQANEKLDEFLKSTFIDMFGNPRTNNKNWSKNTLEGIVANDKHSIKRGPFGGSLKKEIFKESGYLVYEQTHAIHNDYNFARYYIDERKYKEMEIFKVVPGDLIISCSGVTLGRISEIPQNAVPGIINQALLKISLNPEIVDNKYFIALFRNRYVQNKIFELSRGSGIPNMPSISVLKQLQFMIPPIELQNNFAQIVEKGKSQKQKNEEVIKQMDNLFNSLSQKAFKGEL